MRNGTQIFEMDWVTVYLTILKWRDVKSNSCDALPRSFLSAGDFGEAIACGRNYTIVELQLPTSKGNVQVEMRLCVAKM